MNAKYLCYCFLVVLFFSSQFSFSESRKEKNLRDEIEFLYDKARKYIEINLDSALIFAKKQRVLAIEINDELGLIKAYYALGYIYYLQNYYDLAALNYYNGLDVTSNKTSRPFLEQKLGLLQNLGVIYANTYDQQLALNNYTEALKIAQKLELTEDIAMLSYNIGVSYERLESSDDALTWYYKALKINEDENNLVEIADINNSIGNVFNKKTKYDKAKEHYSIALKISSGIEELEKECAFYINNLGENTLKQGNIQQAIEYYNQALNISESLNDVDKIRAVCNNLGDVYLKENDYEVAITYYQKSISLVKSDKNIDDRLKRSFQNIAKAYDALGNFQVASKYKDKYMIQTELLAEIKDNLQEQNTRYRMKELELQREIMQKELMLARAEKENLWGRIIIGVALLLIIFCSRLIYIYYSKISKARKIVNSYRVDFDY